LNKVFLSISTIKKEEIDRLSAEVTRGRKAIFLRASSRAFAVKKNVS